MLDGASRTCSTSDTCTSTDLPIIVPELVAEAVDEVVAATVMAMACSSNFQGGGDGRLNGTGNVGELFEIESSRRRQRSTTTAQTKDQVSGGEGIRTARPRTTPRTRARTTSTILEYARI